MGLLTSGIYGLVSIGSSSSADLQTSMESRLQARLSTLGSTLYKLTWKRWVMPSGVSRFRLRGSVHRTSATAPTGTPAALPITGWVTPTVRDWKDSGADIVSRSDTGRDRFDQLPRQANLAGWPTTTVCDSNRSPAESFATKNVTLNHAAVLTGWRTPTAGTPNSLRGNGQNPEKRAAQGHTVNLTDEVNWLKDNPCPARLTATGELLIGSTAGMENGGQLNPAHSRWLMGLPVEWDACAPTETVLWLKRQKNLSDQHSDLA